MAAASRDDGISLLSTLVNFGAMTAFLYLVMIRDYMYEHIADLTGARVTYSYGRIGGLAHDVPEGWLKRLEEILDEMDTFTGRVHGLVDRNRIFIDRMRDVGVISTAEAVNVLECIAPPGLDIERWLPPAPLSVAALALALRALDDGPTVGLPRDANAEPNS